MSEYNLLLATLLHFATQPPPLGRVVPDASWYRSELRVGSPERWCLRPEN